VTGPRVTPPTRLPAITEKQFQRQVVDLAKTLSWAVYHTQLSKWSESGWPDLALCKPPRLLLVELKSARGKVTPSQQGWLDLLQACDGVEVFCWRPSDWQQITQTLAPVRMRIR
jgi:hypothetical protein